MTESQQTPGTRHTVVVPGSIDMVQLLGPGDDHLALIERSFDLRLHVRGNRITLEGEPGEVALAERLLDELVTLIRTGQGISTETVERVLAMLRAETTERPAEVLSLNILSNRGRSIRPKTLNQKRYVDSIDKHTITFGIGPAGTGKTYLAMAKAVQALQAKQVNRIILTRPAVEAGERLGFLPGTLSEKIDPYLRPLYDALHDMVDPDSIPKLLAAGTIEVAPLAFMRGRSLNDSFIILDEAQNTSPEQMKMFLTRLGFGSKIVVTGDVADRPRRRPPQAGRPDRRGLRRLRRAPAARGAARRRVVARSLRRRRPVTAAPGDPVSIEIIDESGQGLDVTRLAALSRFVLDRMRVHPLAELCIKAVDEPTIAALNEQWMEKEGPTDVLAFPMDELRPGLVNEEPEEGVLGDLVLCPAVAERQGAAAGHGTEAEVELLTVHGILHLLGYDHAEPEEHREMFGLQDELLAAWRAQQ